MSGAAKSKPPADSSRTAPIDVLGRGISIIEFVSGDPDGYTLTEIAAGTGLHVSTVQRLARTLENSGFLSYDAHGKRYRLGLRLFELARRSASTVLEAALPVMRHISRTTGEMASLSALEGTDILYLERVEGSHPLQLAGRIGYRAPSYCTSMGKALLAFTAEPQQSEILSRIEFRRYTPSTIVSLEKLRDELKTTRARGYALAEEEYDQGVRAIAVPILDRYSHPVASLCISAPTLRRSRRDLLDFEKLLAQARSRIESSLI